LTQTNILKMCIGSLLQTILIFSLGIPVKSIFFFSYSDIHLTKQGLS